MFRADGETCGFRITNNETVYIGAGDGAGSIEIEGGSYSVYNWQVGQSKTAALTVAGGTVTGRNQIVVGLNGGSDGTLTVSDGGTVACGGTVRFDNSGVRPECPIHIEDGLVYLTHAMTPANIRIGKKGFLRYDLVDVVDSAAEDQTLAEGVSIELPEGETLAEHVLIRNNGTLMWQAYLDDTTLKARNMTGETVDLTIWTGYKGDNWFTYVQNWTCGVPSSSTKVVFPYAATVNQGTVDLNCGDIVLKTGGKVTIQNGANVTRAYHFWAHEISGDGSLALSVNYLETDDSSDMNINVPVVIAENAYGTFIQGRNGPPGQTVVSNVVMQTQVF